MRRQAALLNARNGMIQISLGALLKRSDKSSSIIQGQVGDMVVFSQIGDKVFHPVGVPTGSFTALAFDLFGGYEQIKQNRRCHVHLFPPQDVYCPVPHLTHLFL